MLRILLWVKKKKQRGEEEKKKKKSRLTIFGYLTFLLRVLQSHCLTGLLGCQCTISHLDHYSSETLWTLAWGTNKATRKKTLQNFLWEEGPTFAHTDLGDMKEVTFISSRWTGIVLRKTFCVSITWSACLVTKPSMWVNKDKRNGPIHAEITTGTITPSTAVPYQVQSTSNLSVLLHLSALFHLIKTSIEADLKNLRASETIWALQ